MDDYNIVKKDQRLESISYAKRTEDSKADFYVFD